MPFKPKRQPRIAVDAMGGDNAPQAVVAGAIEAARRYPHNIVLVGNESSVRMELAKYGEIPKNIRVHHAATVIHMDEPAANSVRRKKDASICVAAELAKNGEVDAIVTAGHTGAAVAASTLRLRLLDGIEKPAIGIVFPTMDGQTMLIDVGANIGTKPIHLCQYASMGHTYFKHILKKDNPSVGILNIGEEETKGTDVIREAHQMLENSNLNFIGNVEGRDIFTGTVNVIVCDGFVGNVVLKVAESITDVISTLLKRELKRNFMTQLGAMLSRSAFKALNREVDYSEYGGAPLLGINGICIISHGKSNPNAIKNAIRVAGEYALLEVNNRIVEEMQFKQAHE